MFLLYFLDNTFSAYVPTRSYNSAPSSTPRWQIKYLYIHIYIFIYIHIYIYIYIYICGYSTSIVYIISIITSLFPHFFSSHHNQWNGLLFMNRESWEALRRLKLVFCYMFMSSSPCQCTYYVPLLYLCGYYYVKATAVLKGKDI